jgi:hypothetical protein
MFKDVIQYLVGLLHPEPEQTVSKEIEGFHYRVVPTQHGLEIGPQIVKPHPVPPVATPVLQLATLSGLVAAFTSNVDKFASKGASAVQVESFDSVALVSLEADEFGRRHVWARAKSNEVNPFKFGEYLEPETFLITAQAGFMPIDGHYTNMLKLCSSLKAGSSVQVADDGYSQKVVIQEGGVTHGEVELPPRVALRPYRTFREVDPVESEFLLRFKAQKEALPLAALISVDAGRWKTDTALVVADWLRKNLPSGTTVIA